MRSLGRLAIFTVRFSQRGLAASALPGALAGGAATAGLAGLAGPAGLVDMMGHSCLATKE